MSIFDNRKVCAAVRTREDFEVALESKVEVIYLLYSNILTVKQHIDEGHAMNKKIFVHMDFAEGIGKDRAGLEYIKSLGADGIVTTRTNLIRPAKEMGLFTIQRFFIVDSHSVDTAVESIRIAKPDVVEIMPGVVRKKIREFSQKVSTDILAGGLVEFPEDVDLAIEAGATAVSTNDRKLWNYK